MRYEEERTIIEAEKCDQVSERKFNGFCKSNFNLLK